MAAEHPSQDAIVRLNALIDGEASPGERAALAERLAHDRELAQAHATLARLKACVVASADASAPDAPRVSVPRPVRYRWAAGAAVAVIAAAGMVAVLSALHEPAVPSAEAEATVVRHAALPSNPVVPDLSLAGLKLTGIAMEAAAGLPAVLATYRGPRGCRLELRVMAAGTEPAPSAGTASRVWSAGGLRYELVAFGMPAARFLAVAGLAEGAVRDGAVARSRSNVQQAALASPPCVG